MPVIVGCGDDGDAVKAAELWGQSQSSGMGGGVAVLHGRQAASRWRCGQALNSISTGLLEGEARCGSAVVPPSQLGKTTQKRGYLGRLLKPLWEFEGRDKSMGDLPAFKARGKKRPPTGRSKLSGAGTLGGERWVEQV